MKTNQFHLSRRETALRCSVMGGRTADIPLVRVKSSKRVRSICDAYRRKHGMRLADPQEILKMKSDDLFNNYKATSTKPLGIHVDWWRHNRLYRPVYLSYDNVSMSLKGFPSGSKAILCKMPTFVTPTFVEQNSHLIKDTHAKKSTKSRR